MKKCCIIIILSCCSLLTVAQTSAYHPFADSNAVWNVHEGACCWANCPGLPVTNPMIMDTYVSYYIQGDTVINSVLYHKIYKSGSSYEHCALGGSINNWYPIPETYVGAFRDDVASKKVFIIYGTAECLLYDFNLQVGDSAVENCGATTTCAVVTSIDSVFINGNYRKSINLSTGYSLIEGIGSTAGHFMPLCFLELIGTLQCYSENGVVLYPDNVTTCSILTGTPSATIPEFSIGPNPFLNTITVDPGNFSESFSYYLYSNTGGLVMNECNVTGKIALDVPYLSSGMYLMLIMTSSGQTISRKFIAE